MSEEHRSRRSSDVLTRGGRIWMQQSAFFLAICIGTSVQPCKVSERRPGDLRIGCTNE